MSTDPIAELWLALDAQRGSTPMDASALAGIIRERALEVRADQLHEIIRRLGPRAGELSCPPELASLIARLVDASPPPSILDPWAGAGTLLIPLAEHLHASAVGVYPNEAALELAKSVTTDAQVSWITGDPLTALDQLSDRFGLVVSCLPLGMPPAKIELALGERTVTVQDDRGHLFLLRACELLSKDGVGIFLVSPKFVSQAKPKAAFSRLSDLGLHLDSYFALPSRFLAPLTNVATALALIRRGEAQEVFVGEWSENADANDVLVRNWQERRPGRSASLGALVPHADFRGFREIAARERISELARAMGVEPVALADLANEINLTRESQPPGFEEQPNAVYLPMIGNSNAVSSLADLRLKPHNYAQIVIEPGVADANYLAGFLNTPLGLAIRESGLSGTAIPKLTKSSIQSLNVFLPDPSTQETTVAASIEIKNLASELRELEVQLWARPRKMEETQKKLRAVNHEERFADWLDTLPFPMASILWTYHASAGDEQRRYECLLHFFEALAEFLAAVLLSGFRSAPDFELELADLSTSLRKHALSVDRSSFGTWISIVERMAKQGRSLMNSGEEDLSRVREMFATRDKRVLEMLFSSLNVSLMKEIGALRNSWKGHGGIIGQEEARRRHLKLSEQLAKLRESVGAAWDDYPLLKPRQSTFRAGRFEYSADRIMGSRTPFEVVDVFVAEPMEDDQLHLLGRGESRPLKVLPFIKVMPSPRTAQNACYFYNRREGEKLRFVSYHFESEAEVVEAFTDTETALRLLEG